VSGGFYKIRLAATQTSGQWVLPTWSLPRQISGSTVTENLDANPSIPYELLMYLPNGGVTVGPVKGMYEVHEFRIVPSSGSPVAWESLVQVTGPTGSPVLTDLVDARLDALEASNPSGPATTLVNISDMTAPARTFNAQTSTANMLTYLAAAPLASPALTGNPTAPTPTAGDNDTTIATTAFVTTAIGSGGITTNSPTFTGTTDLVNLDVSGTTAFAAGSIAQAAVANLVSDLAGKVGAASPTITGTADLVNLDVSGTAVFAAGSIAQAAVANLTTDLTAKAAVASPTFTGTPAAPTAAAGTDTTQVATTAFVQDHTAWAYGIQPRCVWTGTVWPTRASVTPAGYTGAIEFWSPYDAAATAPTDRVLNDLWTRKRTT
jgi:hypothetical protein